MTLLPSGFYGERAPLWWKRSFILNKGIVTIALIKWKALHTISAQGAWQALSVTMPLLSIKDFAVANFHQNVASFPGRR